MHGRPFESDAQVIEFLHLLEIEWLYLPATAEQHLHMALPLQAVQCFPHRCPAGVQAGSDIPLAESVAGDQAELEDVLFQGLIDPVGYGLFSSRVCHWHRFPSWSARLPRLGQALEAI